MPVRAVDDKSSDTLVGVSGEGFWTGSSTLPHLHQHTVLEAPVHGGDAGSPPTAKGESTSTIGLMASSPAPLVTGCAPDRLTWGWCDQLDAQYVAEGT